MKLLPMTVSGSGPGASTGASAYASTPPSGCMAGWLLEQLASAMVNAVIERRFMPCTSVQAATEPPVRDARDHGLITGWTAQPARAAV